MIPTTLANPATPIQQYTQQLTPIDLTPIDLYSPKQLQIENFERTYLDSSIKWFILFLNKVDIQSLC